MMKVMMHARLGVRFLCTLRAGGFYLINLCGLDG